jgi:hypothetical protein
MVEKQRRRFLRLSVASAAFGLAGCSQIPEVTDDSREDPDEQTNEQVIDEQTQTPTATPVATLTPTATPTATPAPETPTETPTPTPTRRPTQQSSKLAATDGDSEDMFGDTVAVSSTGETAIIGATNDEDPDRDGPGPYVIEDKAGSAYVFTRSNGMWTQQAKLVPDDRDQNQFFGGAVAISGDGTTALITAPGNGDPNGDNSGAAYIFTQADGTWTQQAKLVPEDGDGNDSFGDSAAIAEDGTTVVITATGDEDGDRSSSGNVVKNNAGSAYVFTQSDGTWTQQTKLVAADRDDNDSFGDAVAVSGAGETAVIGAINDEDPNKTTSGIESDAGSAYVFTESDGVWDQQAKLVPSDRNQGDLFGDAIAVSHDGTTAVITASEDNTANGNNAGSAYVFTQSGGTWTQQEKLIPDDGSRNDSFGNAVALSGDGSTAVIGAANDNVPNGENAGSAYVFTQSDSAWTQQKKLVANDADHTDSFGDAVSIASNGGPALISASNDDDPNGDGAGSAYVFE